MGRRRYAYEVKEAIRESGNVNLFPELGIPKSTAYHWIQHSPVKPIEVDDKDGDFESVSEFLKILLSYITEFKFNIDSLGVKESEKLEKQFKDATPKLRTILPKKIFNEIKRTLFPCTASVSRTCIKRYPSQLTEDEKRKMKELVTSKKLAHLPVSSLAIYAQRKGILSCGLQTWYKYISKFGWVRHYNNAKKRKFRTKAFPLNIVTNIGTWTLHGLGLKTEVSAVYKSSKIINQGPS